MKKFLIRTCLFAVIIGVTLAIGEVLVRLTPNPYATKDAYITAHGKDIHTLILGNSHSFYGVRTDLMPVMAVNLGNVSQPLAYDRMIFDHYLPMVPNLKRVILQISYTTLLEKEIESGDEWWRAIDYKLYMHIGRHGNMTRYAYELFYMPVYCGKLGNVFGLTEPSLTCDSLGNGLGYTLANRPGNLDDGAVEIAERHIRSHIDSRWPVNLAHLKSIADSCASHNIELVVFTQPAWHTYRENILKERRATLEKTLADMSREKGFLYLNYFDDARFVNEDFYDADHLTHDHGAIKLTNMLMEDIESHSR